MSTAMKPGDTVTVYVYETLVHEVPYVLTEDDFDEEGDLDESAVEDAVIENGIDWNDCQVMSRETRVEQT